MIVRLEYVVNGISKVVGRRAGPRVRVSLLERGGGEKQKGIGDRQKAIS
jgi:hypothetical protein